MRSDRIVKQLLTVVALGGPGTLGAQQPGALTVARAEAYITTAERRLAHLGVRVARISWVAANFITDDTEILSAEAQAEYGRLVQLLATGAAQFDNVRMPPELRRRFLLLKLSLAAPPPADSADGVEMTRLQVGLEADYGRGVYCRAPAGGTQECLALDTLSRILAQSRNPAELLEAWQGWHTVGAPMRDRYARFMELANAGARTLGFRDLGAMWRAGYDMPADDFATEVERLWQEDFVTIHHELGHNFYQRAYQDLSFLYQNGAHDGFHEAIGDAIALAITPEYLVRVGLLDRTPGVAADTALLLRQALSSVAFLPFGLLIDQWRWRVFSGEVRPADYNRAWWAHKSRYQGVGAPGPRGLDAFDPGAKYHVPGNTPYTRYFLAGILQFQLYRALCQAAEHRGPLYRCSLYGSEKAGRKLDSLLRLGASRPWPDALEALTGSREMDAGALLEYFQPLQVWLDRQNQGAPVGW